jgi:di/tricarboxylate transporter
MRWSPESRAGWWSVALAGVTVASIALLVLVVYLLGAVEPADSYTDDWVQTAWGSLIWVSALGCFVAGVVAITRRHERSGLVLVATLLGLLPVALLISEVALGKF